jgi:hypothetical protein
MKWALKPGPWGAGGVTRRSIRAAFHADRSALKNKGSSRWHACVTEARGTVDHPEHPLHGAKVDIVNTAPDRDFIVRLREPHGRYIIGALAKLRADRFNREPP